MEVEFKTMLGISLFWAYIRLGFHYIIDLKMQRPKLMLTSCDSNKHALILIIIFIIILDCVLLQENVCNASAMPKMHSHHQNNQYNHNSSSRKQKKPNHFRRKKTSRLSKASKLSDAESLGCDAGLSRSVFTYMDKICHSCFNLFREIEIYYMCRWDFIICTNK